MNIDIIHERLKRYSPQTSEDEEHALKEILQEIILYALSTTDFFAKGAFHGGTALRILHGLPRFSEDLDFLLKTPTKNFSWEYYLNAIITTCKEFGIAPEVYDKSKLGKTVQKMFLKDNSIGKLLKLAFHHHSGRKLAIKLEIDTNPPVGSVTEINFLDFPLDYSIVAQNLSSDFAGKSHALLCRKYVKGRDWYDFTWYVKKAVKPNFAFLTSSIDQQGPWKKQHITITPDWFLTALKNKIATLDWKKAISDVGPFLPPAERQSLKIWGVDFFMAKLNKLSLLLQPASR
ncbi:MAG: nucleotidyl transferase AbiEii/AbiGii toxin family protein [Gammaproteobacteria bacterium]|nr:nucleotidyl transferase AbiEii/AbiGii toxin family protein [Gammaproteobacteria bacterium]